MIIRNKSKSKKSSKFYRPSKHSLYNQSCFINQIVDMHTVGVDGIKKHSYKNTTINRYLEIPAKIRHRYYRGEENEDISPTLKTDDKVAHFNGHLTMYYTNSPFAVEHRALICFDIDPKETTKEQDLNDIVMWLVDIFPSCYWELSSSGKGIHYYILIDFSPFAKKYGTVKYAKYVNQFLYRDPLSLSNLLMLYVNNRFNVSFCGIKATLSEYEWDKEINNYQLTCAGILCAYPHLTPSNCQQLYKCSTYTVDILLNKMDWLLNELQEQVPNIHKTKIGTINRVLSDLPPMSANSDELKSHSDGKAYLPTSYYYNNCLSKSTFESNNKDFSNDGKAFRQECERYFRQVWKTDNRIPTIDECAIQLQVIGAVDYDKLVRLYNCVRRRFDPNKMGVWYEKSMLIPYIKNTFNKQEYKTILAGTTAANRRPKNVLLDLFGGYCLTHLSTNRELTLSTYSGFRKFCEKHGVNISNDQICLACRLLYEHYGWLEQLNSEYTPPSVDDGGKATKGVCMAYTLTAQFPFYHLYENAVGKTNIDRVRAKGLSSMQDWGNMGIVG
jgi:hypothetical protein